MADLSEAETRKKIIDPQLKEVGWLKAYVKDEVNSLKSNFKTKDYVPFNGEIERGKDRFIDYLLLGEDNAPLAIIEAKKSSVSFYKGRIQAETYVKDIDKQTKEKLPIFLTNGNEWLFIDQEGVERKISKPFTQEDLKRRRELFINKRDPSNNKIDPKIVDREKSILIVKKLSEHFGQGHRSALVNMATGTGKTRVAMALINVLTNANYVKNVLFVVDRISLANQAKEAGFKKFFNEPVCELNVEGFSSTARFYVSTVQTLMGKKGKYLFEKFSPGFFDLIIFDEAHRSIYDRNNLIMRYFDSLKIGLTATPSKGDRKNTAKLFDCENDEPTVKYDYNDAVRDGVLASYNAQIIETKVLSLGIEGKKLTSDLKTMLMKQEENPECLELPGASFDRVFMDSKTNEVIIREFMARCQKTDDLIPCKTIFFCASIRHAKEMKRLFTQLYPGLSKEVKIITSDMARYMDEVQRFKLDSEPRIALSVGILDTGIDIPEICNLVFIKPVFSSIRFWQMLGRGTRNFKSCTHKDWLPTNEGFPSKEDFLILDFQFGDHSNVRYHKLKESKEKAGSLDAKTKIFLQRLELLEKSLEDGERKVVEDKVIETVNSLDKKSFIIKEKLPIIKKVVSRKFDLKEHIKELREEIAPLLIFTPADNAKIYAFILKVEKLFDHIKEEQFDKIDKIRDYVLGKLKNILQRDNLDAVKSKNDEIKKVFQEEFWDDLTFDDVEFLVKEIAPLMIYYITNPKRVLQVEAPDWVIAEENIKMEVQEDPKFKEFIEKNPLIQKIKKGEGITSKEILELEKQLSKLDFSWTIEKVQKFRKKDFLIFLHQILGLSQEYDPKVMIEREFGKHIMHNSQKYNSDQLEFLSLLKKVFSERKYIEKKDFASHPLAEERPLDKFSEEQIDEIVVKCGKLRMR